MIVVDLHSQSIKLRFQPINLSLQTPNHDIVEEKYDDGWHNTLEYLLLWITTYSSLISSSGVR